MHTVLPGIQTMVQRSSPQSVAQILASAVIRLIARGAYSRVWIVSGMTTIDRVRFLTVERERLSPRDDFLR